MSVPGYEPLSRPPREGDPVKVVLTGRIDQLVTSDGDELAEVVLDIPGHTDIRITLPVEQVWNQARPGPDDQPL